MTFLESLRNHPLGVRLAQLVPLRTWQQRPRLFFSLCAVTVVSSLLLGGGTRGGFLSDTILELIAIPAFLASVSSIVALPRSRSKRRAEWALLLCLAIAALPLVQLVPLPPWLWTELPNREQMVAVFGLLGQELPWLPISVSPSATWVSICFPLLPFTIFLGVIEQLPWRRVSLISRSGLSPRLSNAQVAKSQQSLRFCRYQRVRGGWIFRKSEPFRGAALFTAFVWRGVGDERGFHSRFLERSKKF